MACSRIARLTGLAMLTLVAVISAAHAQSTVGTVTQLQGTANVQRAGATLAVALNLPVMLHDKIATDINSSLTISLVDNSSLQLGASSTLTIDESMLVSGVGAPTKVGLLGGQLQSIILGAMRGSSTTFEVHTPNAVAAVRGTGWTERYTEEPQQGYKDCRQFTDVDVLDGTVQVCSGGSQRRCKKDCREVAAGHHVRVACCAIYEGNALFPLGATALGWGLAGGVGVGIGTAAGVFNGPSNPPPPSPLVSPSK